MKFAISLFCSACAVLASRATASDAVLVVGPDIEDLDTDCLEPAVVPLFENAGFNVTHLPDIADLGATGLSEFCVVWLTNGIELANPFCPDSDPTPTQNGFDNLRLYLESSGNVYFSGERALFGRIFQEASDQFIGSIGGGSVDGACDCGLDPTLYADPTHPISTQPVPVSTITALTEHTPHFQTTGNGRGLVYGDSTLTDFPVAVIWEHGDLTQAPAGRVLVFNNSNNGAGFEQWAVNALIYMCGGQSAAADLNVLKVDARNVSGDWQTLATQGAVTAEIGNQTDLSVDSPFEVTFFEDRNFNRRFDPATDADLGQATVPGLLAGESASIQIDFSTNVLFRDNVTYAFADSAELVAESNETNNYDNTGQTCSLEPTVGAFEPELKWSWITSTEPGYQNWLNVGGTPTIMDLDGGGVSEIVFSSGVSTSGGVVAGVLRALSGLDGHEVWTVSDPAYRTNIWANTASADIDGDGLPEIVAVSSTHNNRLICFEHDGVPKQTWLGNPSTPGFSASLAYPLQFGGAAIADLDLDSLPEIIIGRTVLRNDGSIWWASPQGGLGSAPGYTAPLSYAADLDLDGFLEVVAGNRVYYGQDGPTWTAGTVKYSNASLTDGLTAVGNLDQDPQAEIVFVAGGAIRVLEHDMTLKPGWPYLIPGGGIGGPPTIADFDGDGAPEVGVAGRLRYVVVEADGTELWQSVTQDVSSHITGSSVFDFEGDGAAEVIYRDELFLRVYRGSDGVVLFQVPMSSCTAYEYALVADVDADDHAEIVTVANTNCGYGPQKGVHVFGSDSWVPTRKIWNQHAYHITNVNDDGSIPVSEQPHWLYPPSHPYNSFRQNILTDHAPLAVSDLTGSFIRFACSTDPRYATARIGNGGAIAAPAGVPVSFFDGDPATIGELISTVYTSFPLPPGVFQDLSIELPDSYDCTDLLYVVADDAGGLAGTIAECNEGNNIHWAAIESAFDQLVDSTLSIQMEYSNTTYNRHEEALLVDAQARNVGELPLDAPVLLVVETMSYAEAVPGNPDGHTPDGMPYFVFTDPFDDPAVLLPGEASPERTLFFYTGSAHVFFEQSFQAAENHAPFFVSFPVTTTAPGDAYSYQVAAVDPDGHELTYSLKVHPTGMRINETTGLLTWMASEAELGSHAVIVAVTDSRGGSATQQFSVNVGAGPGNSPPAFLSLPNLIAQISTPYEYTVFAFDPDGSSVTYSLESPPAGMTIDEQTGSITWTPPDSDTFSIVVLATDSQGAVGSQQFDLFVAPPNEAPVIVSTSPESVIAGGTYYYNVDATDQNSDVLTYTLLAAPAGMTINAANGLIVWTTGQADLGVHDVTIQVSDPFAAVAVQEIQVTVLPDEIAPQVNIVATPTPAFVDEPVHICVNAGDNASIAARTLMISSVAQALNTAGCVDYTADELGTLILFATATDGAGNVGSAVLDLQVVDPNDPDAPTIEIISPAPLATITEPTEIIATIQDSAPATLEWEVRLSRADSTNYTVIGEGQGEVVNGPVAIFDPSMLPNDTYRITLFASDGVHTFTLPIPYAVSGDYKLGNFSISFTDLTIPIGGIPLVITRQYDSLDTSPADFGPGWRLGLPGRVQDAPRESPLEPLGVGQKVFVTRPDGRRVGFKVQAVPISPFFAFIVNVAFIPEPGVTDELALANPQLVTRAGGYLYTGLFSSPYNPNTYVFTTREKVKYTIDEQTGLQEIEDIFGNTITVTPGGLISSLPEGCTTDCIALTFIRNAAGRITQIIEPDDPNDPNPPGVLHYDDDPTTGNLIAFRDQMNHATQYFYDDAQFPHYLTRIQDPLNNPVVQNLFDADGRLVGQCNAMGDLGGVPADPCTNPDSVPENCTAFCLDPISALQTIINARGFRTDLLLDERGNITERRKFSADGTYMLVTQMTYWDTSDGELTDWLHTESLQTRIPVGQDVGDLPVRLTMTYDERGNVLTRTEHGDEDRTWTYTYWEGCDRVETELDPIDSLTRYEYDEDCNLRFITNAMDGVTEFQYNSRGQRTHFIDAVNNVWEFHYDPSTGLPTGLTDPLLHSSEMQFTTSGELLHQIDRRGWRIDFVYDDAHRVTHEIWRPNIAQGGDLSVDHVTQYGYNAVGLLTSAVDPDSSLAIDYWPTGLVKWVDNEGTPNMQRVRVTYGYWDGVVLKPGYDPNGNITHVMDEWGDGLIPEPQGMTEYQYDEFDRQATILQYSAGGQVNPKRVDMEYYDTDLLMWLRRYADLNGAQSVAHTFHDYDCFGCPSRVKEINHQQPDGTPLHQMTYTRDMLGNILTMNDAEGSHSYTYDDLLQLLTATHPVGGLQPNEFYTYDSVGNRLSSHLSTFYKYSYMPEFAEGGNQLRSDENFEYTYDIAGNLVMKTDLASGGFTTYSYNHRNRMVRAIEYSAMGMVGHDASYRHDAFNRRIRSIEDTEDNYFVYDGRNPILKLGTASPIAIRRMYSRMLDEILADQRGLQTRWFLTDHLGTVRDLIGEGPGAPNNHYVFDSFGSVVDQANPAVLNDLLFNAREYTAGNGLGYYRARQYDPQTGRFASEDPVWPLRYEYAGNNPLVLRDLDGRVIYEYICLALVNTAFFLNDLHDNPGFKAGLLLGAIGRAIRETENVNALNDFIKQEIKGLDTWKKVIWDEIHEYVANKAFTKACGAL